MRLAVGPTEFGGVTSGTHRRSVEQLGRHEFKATKDSHVQVELVTTPSSTDSPVRSGSPSPRSSSTITSGFGSPVSAPSCHRGASARMVRSPVAPPVRPLDHNALATTPPLAPLQPICCQSTASSGFGSPVPARVPPQRATSASADVDVDFLAALHAALTPVDISRSPDNRPLCVKQPPSPASGFGSPVPPARDNSATSSPRAPQTHLARISALPSAQLDGASPVSAQRSLTGSQDIWEAQSSRSVNFARPASLDHRLLLDVSPKSASTCASAGPSRTSPPCVVLSHRRSLSSAVPCLAPPATSPFTAQRSPGACLSPGPSGAGSPQCVPLSPSHSAARRTSLSRDGPSFQAAFQLSSATQRSRRTRRSPLRATSNALSRTSSGFGSPVQQRSDPGRTPLPYASLPISAPSPSLHASNSLPVGSDRGRRCQHTATTRLGKGVASALPLTLFPYAPSVEPRRLQKKRDAATHFATVEEMIADMRRALLRAHQRDASHSAQGRTLLGNVTVTAMTLAHLVSADLSDQLDRDLASGSFELTLDINSPIVTALGSAHITASCAAILQLNSYAKAIAARRTTCCSILRACSSSLCVFGWLAAFAEAAKGSPRFFSLLPQTLSFFKLFVDAGDEPLSVLLLSTRSRDKAFEPVFQCEDEQPQIVLHAVQRVLITGAVRLRSLLCCALDSTVAMLRDGNVSEDEALQGPRDVLAVLRRYGDVAHSMCTCIKDRLVRSVELGLGEAEYGALTAILQSTTDALFAPGDACVIRVGNTYSVNCRGGVFSQLSSLISEVEASLQVPCASCALKVLAAEPHKFAVP